MKTIRDLLPYQIITFCAFLLVLTVYNRISAWASNIEEKGIPVVANFYIPRGC